MSINACGAHASSEIRMENRDVHQTSRWGSSPATLNLSTEHRGATADSIGRAVSAPQRRPVPAERSPCLATEPIAATKWSPLDLAPGPGCCGEVRRAVEPRERECADARGGSRRAALNAGLGAMFAAHVGGILADRRSERDPRTGRPRSVVNRCRAASCWTPRNLHVSVIEDASAHRQAPPGLPRDAVDDAGRHRPPPGTRTAPSRRR